MADIKFGIDFEADTKDAMSGIQKLTQFMKDKFVVTLGDVTSVMGKLVDGLKYVVGQAIEAEKVQHSLNNALKTAGLYTKENSKLAIDFAQSLSQQTIATDEAIMSMQKLLVNTAGLSGKALNDATEKTLNFASALGIDLESAALLVGKTIGGENNLLSRYGINVDDAALKTDRLGAVMQALAKYNGYAAEETNTTSDKIIMLKKSLDELAESIGGVFIKFENYTGILKTATNIIDEFNLKSQRTADLARKDALYKEIRAMKDTIETMKESGKNVAGYWMALSKLEKEYTALHNKIYGLNTEVEKTNNVMSNVEETTKGVIISDQNLIHNTEDVTDAMKEMGNASGKTYDNLYEWTEKNIDKMKEYSDFFAKDLATTIVDGNESIGRSFERLGRKIAIEFIEGRLKELINGWLGVARAADQASASQNGAAEAQGGGGGRGNAGADKYDEALLAVPGVGPLLYAIKKGGNFLRDLMGDKPLIDTGISLGGGNKKGHHTGLLGMGNFLGFLANGIDTVVDKPSFFVAGEKGRERVTVTPGGGQQGSNNGQMINNSIYIDREVIAKAVTKGQFNNSYASR